MLLHALRAPTQYWLDAVACSQGTHSVTARCCCMLSGHPLSNGYDVPAPLCRKHALAVFLNRSSPSTCSMATQTRSLLYTHTGHRALAALLRSITVRPLVSPAPVQWPTQTRPLYTRTGHHALAALLRSGVTSRSHRGPCSAHVQPQSDWGDAACGPAGKL